MLTSLYPARNEDGSRRTEDYDDKGNGPNDIYDYYYYVDRFEDLN